MTDENERPWEAFFREDPRAALMDLTLVLTTVNVRQPIRFPVLLKLLQGHVSEERLSGCLDELLYQERVKRFDRDAYRVTWKGLNSLWSESLRKNRDVRRLWYLFEAGQEEREGSR